MKRKYKKAVLFSYLTLSIALFIYISMCILGSYVSLKYDIDEHYIASDILSKEISEDEEYSLKITEATLNSSIVTYKIVGIYIMINILITMSGIFRLYNSKESEKEQ